MKRSMVALCVLLLVACGTTPPPAAPNEQSIVVGLGYVQDIQFAPFYVALQSGYYKAEGLTVNFQHGDVNDMLVQQGAGKLPFILAAGDEVLSAREKGLTSKMVWQLYQQFPVAVFSKAEQNIVKPSDLRGKTIGIPGRYGATYIGLLGLLTANGMQESDVTLSEIGFNQFQTISEDKVPAAVSYANNEPVRFAAANIPVNVIRVSDSLSLVSNGIVVTEALIQQDPELIRRFLRATERGLQDTLAKPDEAFQQALVYLPELAVDQRPLQRQVLQATLDYWHSPNTDANGLGHQDPQAWQTTYQFLRSSNLLQKDTDVTQAYTNAFVTPTP